MSNTSMTLTLLTEDDQTCTVREDIIVSQSGLIKSLLADVDDYPTIIPIQNVDAKTLNLILEWCGMHAKSKKMEDEMRSWDAEFLDKDQEVLYHLLMAANYLEMHDLLEKISKKVASLITGKSVEEIREILKIENDYTPEQEAAVRAKHSWAFSPISVEQFEEEQRLIAEAREKDTKKAADAAATEENNAKNEEQEEEVAGNLDKLNITD